MTGGQSAARVNDRHSFPLGGPILQLSSRLNREGWGHSSDSVGK